MENTDEIFENIATLQEEFKGEYLEARAAYIADMTDENWKAYCDAKKNCMDMGVEI